MAQLNPLGWIARRTLSPEMIGVIDYYRFPQYRSGFGGPFNGQPGRQAIFNEIVARCRPVAILETGTFRGTTTEYMAAAGLPVFTVEGVARNFGFCRARFRSLDKVELILGDSRAKLREVLDGPLKGRLGETLFFYLDAHWYEDLPLAEEIEIAFDRTERAICMVDDFAVPDDAGYAYDDYGPGKVLDAGYIEPLLRRYGLTAYYPTLKSADEGGMKRGSVVLAKDAIHGQALRECGLRAMTNTQE